MFVQKQTLTMETKHTQKYAISPNYVSTEGCLSNYQTLLRARYLTYS